MSGANTRTHTWKAENTKKWKAQNRNKNRNRMDLKLKGNEWENVKEIKYKEEKRSGARARAFIHKENVKSLKPNWSSANKNCCLRKCEFINHDDDGDNVKKTQNWAVAMVANKSTRRFSSDLNAGKHHELLIRSKRRREKTRKENELPLKSAV